MKGNGAHERTRTSICSSVYGSPVRSRRRLRARIRMIAEKRAPDLIGGGYRFPDEIMRKQMVRLRGYDPRFPV